MKVTVTRVHTFPEIRLGVYGGTALRAGNTAELTAFANCCLPRISPERAPPNVVCTVDDTKSACGTGDGSRPAKCAMSTHRCAPTSSAMSRNAAKSTIRGYADHPPMRTLGRNSLALAL